MCTKNKGFIVKKMISLSWGDIQVSVKLQTLEPEFLNKFFLDKFCIGLLSAGCRHVRTNIIKFEIVLQNFNFNFEVIINLPYEKLCFPFPDLVYWFPFPDLVYLCSL